MLSPRLAALFATALACTRPTPAPQPPRPPPPVRHDPTPPQPPPPTDISYGVGPEVLTYARLEAGDPEAKCTDDGPARARCLQARAHPDVPFFWILYWDEYGHDKHGNGVAYSQHTLLARRQRVVERLRADGASQILDSKASSVRVIAPHRAVRGAMAMSEVAHVTVSCAEEDKDFCACERLRIDQCPQHAFCNSVHGQPRDPAGACMGPRELAGCTRAEGCSDSMTHAIDPTGRSWLFPSSCQPQQPGWRHPERRPQPLPDCPTPRG